jgi:tetratricopeptide (TPR) repeat protein
MDRTKIRSGKRSSSKSTKDRSLIPVPTLVDDEFYYSLGKALGISTPGSFIFVKSNSPVERKKIAQRLRELKLSRPVFYSNIAYDFPSRIPFSSSVSEWIKQNEIGTSPVIFILDGFDLLLSDHKEASLWLQSLNFSRETLASYPVIFLFLMPSFCLDLVRIHAPDLWSWRSFLFQFPEKEKDQLDSRNELQISGVGKFIQKDDDPEKRESRIKVLKSLLDKELQIHGSIEALWNNVMLPLVQDLGDSAQYGEAVNVLLKAQEWINTKSLSPENSEYYSFFGSMKYHLGDLETAEISFRKALEIDEKLFEENHQNVARDVNNIAVVLKEKGDLDAALNYLHRALEIDEKIFGKNNPNVSILVNNIASVLMDKEDLDGVLKYLYRALEIDEKTFGNDHPNVATDVNNISLVLKAKGDLDGALEYLNRALEIDEKTFGKDHPNVARDVNNIATVLQDKGDLDAALEYLNRALEIDEKTFGNDHPNVATDVNNIAMVLQAKGDLDAARKHLKRAYQICIKTYGPDNPHTKEVFNNYLSCGGNSSDLLE